MLLAALATGCYKREKTSQLIGDDPVLLVAITGNKYFRPPLISWIGLTVMISLELLEFSRLLQLLQRRAKWRLQTPPWPSVTRWDSLPPMESSFQALCPRVHGEHWATEPGKWTKFSHRSWMQLKIFRITPSSCNPLLDLGTWCGRTMKNLNWLC